MPKIYEEYWDTDNNRWDVDNPPSYWSGVNQLSNMVTIDYNKRTPIIKVKLENENPNYSADWLNKLVNELDDHLRRQAINESEKSLKFLESEVGANVVKQQESVLFKLILDQKTNNMMANVSEEYAIQVIDPAVVPRNKYTPKKLRGLFIGIVLGLLIGLAIITYKEFDLNRLS